MNEAIDAARQLGLEGNEALQFIREQQELQRAERQDAREEAERTRQEIDRELARFIYVREVKRFDPFKLSIYAWCIKIAIAGSLAPVCLAWGAIIMSAKKWVYLCGGRY